MPASPIAERYLLLGLRLGKHVDGLVDGYFGPPQFQQTVDGENIVDPNVLLDEARALSAEVASSNDDRQRTRWLRGQLDGLVCVAEMVAGAEPPWREAVRRCYGIDVEPTPEEHFRGGAREARRSTWRRRRRRGPLAGVAPIAGGPGRPHRVVDPPHPHAGVPRLRRDRKGRDRDGVRRRLDRPGRRDPPAARRRVRR